MIESKLDELTSKLNNAESLWELVNKTVLIGVWDWHFDNGTLVWDNNMFKLFGVKNPGTSVDYDFFKNCLVPEDHSVVEQSIQDCIRNHTDYKYVFRLASRPGVSIYGNGKCFYDKDGKAYRMMGVNLEAPDACTSSHSL